MLTVITSIRLMSTSSLSYPLKIVAIGNSRGIRLPQVLLRRYGVGEQVMVEERPEGFLLRGDSAGKASLKQTFTEMAREQAAGREDWSDLEAAAADGLDAIKW